MGHSNQVRERLRPHLLHDVSAMKFDRSFAGDQLASDLFVEQRQYQKSEHHSLARGEQVLAVAQLGDLGPLLERVPVSLNSSTDGVQ